MTKNTTDKTRPWEPEEYITIDGHPLPYRIENSQMVVIYPRGITVPLDDLLNEPVTIIMPATIRLNTERQSRRHHADDGSKHLIRKLEERFCA